VTFVTFVYDVYDVCRIFYTYKRMFSFFREVQFWKKRLRLHSSSSPPTTRDLAHAKDSSPIIQNSPKPAVAPQPARPVSVRTGGSMRTGTAAYMDLGTNISAISRIVGLVFFFFCGVMM